MSGSPGVHARNERAPMPRRPYRDAALVYGAMGVFVFFFAWLTGGALLKALLIAIAFTALATGWSWFRFRQRLAAEARAGGAEQRTPPTD